MTLHLLSYDFRHTPIALRERLAFSAHRVPDALGALRARGASEVAILSTCNRVELVATLPAESGADALLSFMVDWHGVARAEIAACGLHLQEAEAARHLIRVACGLESLVPGEMQILGQVKESAQVARQHGALGPMLERLFTSAVSAGRRARHETGIARRPVSISHAAVSWVESTFGNTLNGRDVLLIGSGKIGELAAQQLHRAGARHFIVANRTLERACELAQRWDGMPLSLDEMPEALARVDAVISATGAPHLILHRDHIAAAIARREGRTLLLVDLAVPRDIDPAASELPGVILRDVDGLQATVDQNIALRNGERDTVERIVDEEVERFLREQAARSVAPTIVRLRHSAEEIRAAELEKALGRLGRLSDKERAIIEAMSRGLVNKLLHEPTMRLRAKAASDEGPAFQRTVEELFALEGERP